MSDLDRACCRNLALEQRGEWFTITPEIELLISTFGCPPKPRSIAQKRRILRMHEASKVGGGA